MHLWIQSICHITVTRRGSDTRDLWERSQSYHLLGILIIGAFDGTKYPGYACRAIKIMLRLSDQIYSIMATYFPFFTALECNKVNNKTQYYARMRRQCFVR